MEERLQKLMAQAGIGSRRHCEQLIAAGRVTVNGKVAHLGQKADLDRDKVLVDGQRLVIEKNVYVKVHKPRGVLSSTEDELDRGRPTVRDIVPISGHLYPIGRLDRTSEGLMILTNDGKLTHRLTHPRYGHRKIYIVGVEGQPSAETLIAWREGVKLDGRRTAPVDIEVVESRRAETWLRIAMREGRKHQIRRIAAQLGHPVTRLIRMQIGPIELGNLEPGAWRHLTPGEVAALKRSVQQAAPPRPPAPDRQQSKPRRADRPRGRKPDRD
jgi:pseudouridine synthase